MRSVNNRMYVRFIKPSVDILAAITLLLLLSVPMLLCTLILFFITKGKPFFLQKRLGKNEKIFTIIKFRSLKDYFSKNGKPLPDEKRMYPFGTWLRISHFDELPQLINILKGELSFIGPRPLHPEYLPYYTIDERKRHSCKPGIAGLSQIKAGNFKPWNERLRYDVFYVRHLSLALDIYVIRMFFAHYILKRRREDLFCESFIDFSLRRSAKS